MRRAILLLALAGILALGAGCTNSVVSGPSVSPQPTPESFSRTVWQAEGGSRMVEVIPICDDYVICYAMYASGGNGFSCFYGAEEPALFRKYCPVQIV